MQRALWLVKAIADKSPVLFEQRDLAGKTLKYNEPNKREADAKLSYELNECPIES